MRTHIATDTHAATSRRLAKSHGICNHRTCFQSTALGASIHTSVNITESLWPPTRYTWLPRTATAAFALASRHDRDTHTQRGLHSHRQTPLAAAEETTSHQRSNTRVCTHVRHWAMDGAAGQHRDNTRTQRPGSAPSPAVPRGPNCVWARRQHLPPGVRWRLQREHVVVVSAGIGVNATCDVRSGATHLATHSEIGTHCQ